MTTRGIQHIDVGSQLSRAEWEGVDTHALASGTAFPTDPAPNEMDLFYRTDEHLWYQYDGTDWINLMGGGGATPQEVWEYTTRNLNSDANNTIRDAILNDATKFAGAQIDDIHDDITTLDIILDDIHGTDLPAVKTDTGNIVTDTNELQTDLHDGGRLDLLIDAIKAKTDVIVSGGATEANVTDVHGHVATIDGHITANYASAEKGAIDDWIDAGRLDAILDAIKAKTDTIVAGASAADIWTYGTRALTAYHVSSGGAMNTLADATAMVPTAGYRFWIASTSLGQYFHVEGYMTSWIAVTGVSTHMFYNSYQKVTSGNGAQRMENDTGGSVTYGYWWESVGASVPKPHVFLPDEVLLEKTEDYLIIGSKKYLDDNKEKIESDVDDKLGYKQHRAVLIARGFKMPEDEEYIVKEK